MIDPIAGWWKREQQATFPHITQSAISIIIQDLPTHGSSLKGKPPWKLVRWGHDKDKALGFNFRVESKDQRLPQ